MTTKKKVLVTFTPEELQRLQTIIGFSDCKVRSEYIRRVVLKMPLKFSYRSESLDSLIDECIQLRKELKLVLEMPMDQEQKARIGNTCEAIKLVIYKIYDQCKHT